MFTLLFATAALKATAAVITKATVVSLAKQAAVNYAVKKTIDTIRKEGKK